jgi:hypothetical protein
MRPLIRGMSYVPADGKFWGPHVHAHAGHNGGLTTIHDHHTALQAARAKMFHSIINLSFPFCQTNLVKPETTSSVVFFLKKEPKTLTLRGFNYPAYSETYSSVLQKRYPAGLQFLQPRADETGPTVPGNLHY